MVFHNLRVVVNKKVLNKRILACFDFIIRRGGTRRCKISNCNHDTLSPKRKLYIILQYMPQLSQLKLQPELPQTDKKQMYEFLKPDYMFWKSRNWQMNFVICGMIERPNRKVNHRGALTIQYLGFRHSKEQQLYRKL